MYDLGKLLKRYQVILVHIGLLDGSLCDGDELFSADVVPDHHGQHCKQFLLADLVVPVQVVHPEGKVKLLHPSVELVLLGIFLYWAEMGEDSHEVLKVDFFLLLAAALEEEGMDNPVTKWVDSELRNAEEIFSAEVTFVLLV